ncbi:MAG: hypothetical protein Q9170_002925 [Blastenia crenularia]
MPRLPNQFLRQAHSIDPLLPLLLRSCRDLPSARNELRWLHEHLIASRKPTRHDPMRMRKSLRKRCLERSRGKPLQYIIGDQPFGDLEILCRPGVLIPRPETETWVTHLAHLLSTTPTHNLTSNPPLRILDLCTGTGCIPLHLYFLLHSHLNPTMLGIDISPTAITLSRRNLHHNISKTLLPATANSQLHFTKADIFANEGLWDAEWDIVISNPPYIPPEGFSRTTTRSVRCWEPRRALVPPSPRNTSAVGKGRSADESIGDFFYPRILEIAVNAGAKVVVMEVGDMAQAERVVGMMLRTKRWGSYEIWRDGGLERDAGDEMVRIGEEEILVRGHGNGRVVIGWK